MHVCRFMHLSVDAYGMAQVHGERHEASVGVTFALLHALLLQVLTAYYKVVLY